MVSPRVLPTGWGRRLAAWWALLLLVLSPALSLAGAAMPCALPDAPPGVAARGDGFVAAEAWLASLLAADVPVAARAGDAGGRVLALLVAGSADLAVRERDGVRGLEPVLAAIDRVTTRAEVAGLLARLDRQGLLPVFPGPLRSGTLHGAAAGGHGVPGPGAGSAELAAARALLLAQGASPWQAQQQARVALSLRGALRSVQAPAHAGDAAATWRAALEGDAIGRPVAHWRALLRLQLLVSMGHELPPSLHRHVLVFGHWERLPLPAPQELAWRSAAQLLPHEAARHLQRSGDLSQRLAAAEDILDAVRERFRRQLHRAPWLDRRARAEAVAKLDRLQVRIGSELALPLPSAAALARAWPDTHLGAVLALRALVAQAPGRDPRIGFIHPFAPGAWYHYADNRLLLPLTMLLPPFFDPHAELAQRYGSLGAVLGHELAHLLDRNGRQHDAQGRLHSWWSAHDVRRFGQRFGAVLAAPDDAAFHGDAAADERFADLAGLELAFGALQERRPGAGPDAFFGAWAQLWRHAAGPHAQLARDRAELPLRTLAAFTARGCPTARAPVRIWEGDDAHFTMMNGG